MEGKAVNSPLGLKIELLQAEHGMSTVDLARKMGIKPQNVSKIKRVKWARVTTIHKLSKAFQVPVTYFYDL